MNLQELIERYEMSASARQLIAQTRLLLVASVAGGGKNTIINELLKSNEFHRIISHTTRQPRVNHGVSEIDGQDYHFVSLEEVERLLVEQAFIEAKYVHGNVYGTSVAEVKLAHDQNKIAITDIDVQGVLEYLDVKPDTHAVFLLPPTPEIWLQRLTKRYGDLDAHKDEITKRLRTAHDEIKHIQGDKRFVLVVNNDLETTVERVRGVVDGTVSETSEYAEEVTHELMEFLQTQI